MAAIAVRVRKINAISIKSLNSCAIRGYLSPSMKKTKMTAARLTVMETKEPSNIPVTTASGLTRFSSVRLIGGNREVLKVLPLAPLIAGHRPSSLALVGAFV